MSISINVRFLAYCLLALLVAAARLAQASGDGIEKARGHLLRLVESFPKAVDAYELLNSSTQPGKVSHAAFGIT